MELVVSEGLVYPLTPCCKAQGEATVPVWEDDFLATKWTEVCSSCGQPVHPVFATSVAITDRPGIENMIRQLGCPPMEVVRWANQAQVNAVIHDKVTRRPR